MVIYIDLVILINFIFDGSILLTVDLLLKRNVKMYRVIFGSLSGELSLITLFIGMNDLESNLFKLVLSLLMCILTFGYKDIRYTFYNTLYLYLTGIILGGFMYYLYNEFQIGSELSFKYLIILILSPIVLVIYYKLSMRFKNNYNNRYRVVINYGDSVFEGIGFLDSGNKLVSPISGKPILLVEKEYITLHKLKLLPVPYNALNHHGIVYCFKPDLLLINGVEYKDILIGLAESKFNIDGVNVLLNARMEII